MIILMSELDFLTYKHGRNEPELYIIWLHGLGASYQDFYQAPTMLGLSSQLNIEFIFPQAPNMAVTINNGAYMPAWYDLSSLSFDQEEDLTNIEASSSKIMSIVNALPKNAKVILCGFSQGGAIALHAGLTNSNISAVIALSTYLPLMSVPNYWEKNMHNRLPILFCHGNADPVVPLQLALMSQSFLDHVSLKTYTMQHEFIMEEALELGKFITNCYHEN